MPHYQDGTPAKRGDVARGKGYNVPYEITGVVLHVTPGTDACNIKVAHAVPQQVGSDEDPAVIPMINIEYGAAADFRKVG